MKRPGAPAFLDTSYVIRYLTNDPPDMAAEAAAVIDREESLVLSELVLVESAYVLSSVYRLPRAEIVDALMALVQRSNIRLLHLTKPRILAGLSLCRNSHRHSFTDALLWAEARDNGAERLYTFDRKFPDEGLALSGVKEE